MNITMKKIFAILSLATFTFTVNAQQQFQTSQYQDNPYIINPANAGVYNYIDISAGFRQQWAGMKNAPRTMFLSGSAPLGRRGIPKYNPSLRTGSRGPVQTPTISTGNLKHAVGGMVIMDEYGAFKHLQVMGSYAIHLPVVRGYNLSFGISGGMSNYGFREDRVDLLIDNDQTYLNFLSGNPNTSYFDMNTGLLFYSNELFIGYSSGQLLRNAIIGNNTKDFDLRMHHFIRGGYNIAVSKELTVTPSFLLKYMSPAPMSFDATVKVTYDKFIWGGLSYRHGDAAIAMIGMNINDLFKFGYAFDFSINSLRPYNFGSHEITLGVTIK